MKRSIKGYFFFLALLALTTPALGQSRQELEKQRSAIIKEIEKTSKALETTRKSKEKNKAQLRALEAQMESRRKLLENLEVEIALNDQIIRENEASLSDLTLRYTQLQQQYGNMLRAGYIKKISNSKWIYLLSSASLNQFMMRWRYMSQFEQFTAQKLSQIKTVKGDILLKNEEISKTREQKLAALAESARNIELLTKEQQEKDALVKKLDKEEEKLRGRLKKSQRERENLNAAIERIILAEIAKATKTEEKATSANTSKKSKTSGTGFLSLQGTMPWPVNAGKITSRFGTHPHPTLPNIQVSNSGVDFTLNSQQEVSCVYDGEVVGLIFMPGFKNVVIIRHDQYSTVYAKLDEVFVKKGQKVQKGKVLGKAGLDEEGKREMHFELWREKTKLDPQQWFGK